MDSDHDKASGIVVIYSRYTRSGLLEDGACLECDLVIW